MSKLFAALRSFWGDAKSLTRGLIRFAAVGFIVWIFGVVCHWLHLVVLENVAITIITVVEAVLLAITWRLISINFAKE